MTPEANPKRPIGIWILTIGDGFAAGVIPLGLLLYFYFNDDAREIMALSTAVMFASMSLAVGICVSAFRTWNGDDGSRKMLLTLITVHWGYIIYQNSMLLFSESALQLTSDQQTKLYAHIVRSVLWIGVNYWYFLGSRPRAFFALREQAEKVGRKTKT